MSKNLISFSGSHGCGKTTSAYSLCTKLKMAGKNVLVLDEFARTCPFEINQNSGTKTQRWLITKQMCSELELIDKFEYVITDRTVMDPYAYAITLGQDWIECYMPAIENHIKTYCYKIYIPEPTAFNYQIDDGTRDLDPEFRAKVFENILTSYNKCGIDYTIISDLSDVYHDLEDLKFNGTK